MIESVLTRKHASVKTKITVKSLVSVGIIALAVILPQLAHFVVGAQAGVRWLPMYLPILLGGCILGCRWGLAVGMISPLVSFLITSAAGEAMPALTRLPFMMAELAVFAFICGLFSEKIEKNPLMAFPAVIAAEVGGRAFFVLLVALFQAFTPLTVSMVLGQIKTGLVGLAVQAVIAPAAVIGLKYLMSRDKSDD